MSGAEVIESKGRSTEGNAIERDDSQTAQSSALDALIADAYPLNTDEGSSITTKDSKPSARMEDGKLSFDMDKDGSEFDDFAKARLGEATWQTSPNKELTALQRRGGADYISQVLNEYGYKDIYDISGQKLGEKLQAHPDFKEIEPKVENLKPGDIIIGYRFDRNDVSFSPTQVGIVGQNGKYMTNSAMDINGLPGRIIERPVNSFLGSKRFAGGFSVFRPPAEIKDREE